MYITYKLVVTNTTISCYYYWNAENIINIFWKEFYKKKIKIYKINIWIFIFSSCNTVQVLCFESSWIINFFVLILHYFFIRKHIDLKFNFNKSLFTFTATTPRWPATQRASLTPPLVQEVVASVMQGAYPHWCGFI